MSLSSQVEVSMPPGADRPVSAKGHSAVRQFLLRTAVGLLGGYGVAHASAAVGAFALFRTGAVSRPDAVLIATNLAILIYPAFIAWAFASRRLLRLALAAALASGAGAVLVAAA